MSDLISDVALSIFRVDQKLSFGRTKAGADEVWRGLGPDGRKRWRSLSKAAIEAVDKSRMPASVPARSAPSAPIRSVSSARR